MKRKQITAILMSAIMMVSACMPMNSMQALAAENADASGTAAVAAVEEEQADSAQDTAEVEEPQAAEPEIPAPAVNGDENGDESGNSASTEDPDNNKGTGAEGVTEDTKGDTEVADEGSTEVTEDDSFEAADEGVTDAVAEEEAVQTSDGQDKDAIEENEEETAKALRMMPDGKKWLFTGDLGHMDEDGFVYFHQRISRMIVTNGYNVYPGQIENELDKCREVSYSCVIGVKDRRRGKRIRAYVVLRDGVKGDEACKKRILDQLKLSVAAYALPKELIFRKELPKTLVGKGAYRKLEEEAAQETAE